jgi:hypothetical protein
MPVKTPFSVKCHMCVEQVLVAEVQYALTGDRSNRALPVGKTGKTECYQQGDSRDFRQVASHKTGY